MAPFFRGFILFLFGAIVGAGGILFFTPTFNVVVSRNPGSLKPVEFAPVAPVTAVAKTPAPVPVVVTAKPAVVEAAKPAPTIVASAEPALDFKSLSEHLILWPTSVAVTTATTVPVLADGKKVQDLALEAGTVLQLSKVLADGSLEVRAKGAKFEIKSAQTDFSAELGKRVADLVAKGTKMDSPFLVSPSVAAAPVVAPVTPVPAVALVDAPVVVVATAPKGPLTLAQKVDILFGVKPDVQVAPASAPAIGAPTPATPPAAAVVPTPSAEPKAAEKGKDLDRKINQLFK
jgi:hypothetical protein